MPARGCPFIGRDNTRKDLGIRVAIINKIWFSDTEVASERCYDNKVKGDRGEDECGEVGAVERHRSDPRIRPTWQLFRILRQAGATVAHNDVRARFQIELACVTGEVTKKIFD